MATVAFKDYAPTLSGLGVTKTDCDKTALKEVPASGGEPNLTKTKALNAIKEFGDIEKANGFLEIANKAGLTKSQVETLYKEFLLTKNPPEKEEAQQVEEL